jgi:nucleoside-diphosphate-sugar epimerase
MQPPSEATADALHTSPHDVLVAHMHTLREGLLVIGAGGKMGPTLCQLARNAARQAQRDIRIVAVSRFTDADVRARLDDAGIETIACDLLAPGALESLPDIPNIVFMAGRKFGSTGNEPLTWAMNVTLPALVMRRFPRARIVALSTGNVYPFTLAALRGAKEYDAPAPVGEYGWSCLGRERVMTHESIERGTPLCILRLNYAIDVRYGVLVDIARRVRDGEAIDLAMGHVNMIWQGDANTGILLAFARTESPPALFNMTGRENWAVRQLATCFADIFDREPVFTGSESETALLSDATRFHDTFVCPQTGIDTMIRHVAMWLERDGPLWNKPTHYEQRDGAF